MSKVVTSSFRDPAGFLFVQENDLSFKTTQFNMSQGMFRALALVIHVNYLSLSKKRATILIDDIGEGLDFERSSKLISLLCEKAKKSDFHLVMTTNDRFVMNKIPLEYWSIIYREGDAVKIVNSKNSKKLFKEFEYIGLNKVFLNL